MGISTAGFEASRGNLGSLRNERGLTKEGFQQQLGFKTGLKGKKNLGGCRSSAKTWSRALELLASPSQAGPQAPGRERELEEICMCRPPSHSSRGGPPQSPYSSL